MKLYALRVVKHWQRLPREAVGAQSLEALRIRLEGALSNPIYQRCPCSLQGG